MYIDNNILYLNEKLQFEDFNEIVNSVDNVEEIIVETNDIHPSIMQLLLTITKTKKVVILDEFMRRVPIMSDIIGCINFIQVVYNGIPFFLSVIHIF